MKPHYKIRHRVTGKFSKGGTNADARGLGYCWNTVGKTWVGIGPLRLHLNSHVNRTYPTDVKDWEVLEIEMHVKAVKPVHEMLNPKTIVQLLKK